MKNYNKNFALVYDKGWNNFSVKVFDYFKEELKNKDVCDVCCGTGNFIKLANVVTKSIYGLDISKDFIKYAKEKNPKVKFKILDIQKWQDKNKYDVVTCFYDSVNHFSNWQKAFKNIYNSLKKKGKFIFDINTKEAFKHWDGIFLNNIGDNYVYQEASILSPVLVKVKIRVFDKQKKLIDNEEIMEKTYKEKDIIKMLKVAGFSEIKNIKNIFNPNSKRREFFICVK